MKTLKMTQSKNNSAQNVLFDNMCNKFNFNMT